MTLRWPGVRWALIAAALALVAVVLGYVGFEMDPDPEISGAPWTHKLYLSLQLFVLETGWEYTPPEHWWEPLNVARFLAPGVAAWAVIAALLAFFGDRVKAARVRWFAREHAVVIGLGRTGSLIAQGMRKRGDRVVAIEKEVTSPAIGESEDEGATVLVGDATDASLLKGARVDRAKYLFVTAGDDGANAAIATTVRGLIPLRRRGVSCFVRVHDDGLLDLLTAEASVQAAEGLRIEPFHPSERGAPALLNRYPPFDEKGKTPLGPPHLLVLGLGETGRRLVLHAARRWRATVDDAAGKLRVTVIDREARANVDWLELVDPDLPSSCQIACHELDVTSAAFERNGGIAELEQSVTGVYVCLGDDASGLTAGLRLRRLFRRTRGSSVPIVIRTKEARSVFSLLGDEAASVEDLHIFELLRVTTRPEVLLAGRTETLARAIHAAYVRQQAARGTSPADNPSTVGWDELPEHLKESNRQQADDIGRKLAAVGCVIEPQRADGAPPATFSRTEVELLAAMEHERWKREREAQGWRHAPEKDVDRKLTPLLVPWEELPNEEKQKDRDSVLGIPEFLAAAGLRVVRL